MSSSANVADLPVLPWDQLPSPDAEVWRAHDLDAGWVGGFTQTLAGVRSDFTGETVVPCTYVDGVPVRCPDGEPPKPEPVITIDGQVRAPDGWALCRPDQVHRTRDAAQRSADDWNKIERDLTPWVVVPVLLPEDKETKA